MYPNMRDASPSPTTPKPTKSDNPAVVPLKRLGAIRKARRVTGVARMAGGSQATASAKISSSAPASP